MPIDAGNFALHLEEAESHLQEGHPVFSTRMEHLPHCLHGSEHRGHRGLSEPYTAHGGPSIHGSPAMKETSHMQPKHPEGGKGHQGKECGQMERKGTEQN